MKISKVEKLFAVVCASAVMLFAAGCSKSEENSTSEQAVANASESVETTVDANLDGNAVVEAADVSIPSYVNMVPSVSLYDESSLWVPNADGNMVWYKTVLQGTNVDLFPSDTDSYGVETIKTKRITSGSSVEREFSRGVYEGKECYVQKNITAVAAKPAVCIDTEAYLYTKPELTAMRTPALEVSLNDIVGIYTDQSDCEGTIFKKICVKIGENIYENVYVKNNKISERTNDVLVVQFLRRAELTSSATVRKEAISFADYFMSIATKNDEAADSIASLYEEISGKYNVTDSFESDKILNSSGYYANALVVDTGDGSKVTVRDLPSRTGVAKCTIPDGTIVRSIRQTADEDTVSGKTDYWYYVTTMISDMGELQPGVEGWVFGAWLSTYEGEAIYDWQ